MTRRQLFAAVAGLVASLLVPKQNHADDGQLVTVSDAKAVVRLAFCKDVLFIGKPYSCHIHYFPANA